MPIVTRICAACEYSHGERRFHTRTSATAPVPLAANSRTFHKSTISPRRIFPTVILRCRFAGPPVQEPRAIPPPRSRPHAKPPKQDSWNGTVSYSRLISPESPRLRSEPDSASILCGEGPFRAIKPDRHRSIAIRSQESSTPHSPAQFDTRPRK